MINPPLLTPHYHRAKLFIGVRRNYGYPQNHCAWQCGSLCENLVTPPSDLAGARRNAAAIAKGADKLRTMAPEAGSYVSEGNYFDRDWQPANRGRVHRCACFRWPDRPQPLKPCRKHPQSGQFASLAYPAAPEPYPCCLCRQRPHPNNRRVRRIFEAQVEHAHVIIFG